MIIRPHENRGAIKTDRARQETSRLIEAILEIQVNAALAGHDYGPFEAVDTWTKGGYEARYRRCQKKVRSG